ncbi:MAG: VWA domain-containing protein, partial [Candidatus Omnitrophica bacterium]|nr:VWA domain-containing protein [Candidatus Omnitrophota bacterium]
MFFQNLMKRGGGLRLPKSAMFNPKWEHPDFQREGATLTAFVLDVSGSMSLTDYLPTRLGAGKQAINAYSENRRRHRPNDCVGLVTFETTAKVVCPLAWLDHPQQFQTFQRRLSNVEAGGATRLDLGLSLAKDLLWCGNPSNRQDLNRPVRFYVLTDGHSEGRPERVAKQVKQAGIVIEIVGIGGSPDEVNEPVLKRCASVENGKLLYRFIGDGDS